MSSRFISIPYRWFYRVEDYLRNPKYLIRTLVLWHKNINHVIRELKWCWQRAFRGWGDCDCWSMQSYLIDIIIPMLEAMKGRSVSYPGVRGASTPEQWDTRLDEMIEGFEAARRVIELDYQIDAPEWKGLMESDIKLFKARMKIFTKWFFALWD